MARNTKIQLRRGTAAQWNSETNDGYDPILAEGEIGYEIDTNRFKIGKTGGTPWSFLPYAGGSDIIPGTGIATIFDEANNTYTIHSIIESSGNGLYVEKIDFSGDGLEAASGTFYRIGLDDRLQELANYNGSGILVGINESGVIARSLINGTNIKIDNADGIGGNPTIGLSSDIQLNSVDVTGAIGLNVSGNANVSGTLTINSLLFNNGNTASIVLGNIYSYGSGVFENGVYVGDSTISTDSITTPILYSNSGVFTDSVTVGGTGVSLSGHKHVYTDVTDFCYGVASCVDTALVASTGLQFNYMAGSPDQLKISLSGQSLALHNFNSNGIIVRTGVAEFVARTISASGNNIFVGDGSGINGNPTIGLNPSLLVQSLTTSGNVVIEGNLTVNGTTVTTNVDTVTVEDPSITVGKPSGDLSEYDFKDRGIEFVYQTGNIVQITGFFGYDHSANAWTFLNSATNNDGIYSGTEGLLNIGGLYSSGGISGTVLTSTVTNNNAPLVVNAIGLVTNLNSDLLDGEHGSYYRNWGSLTGIPNPTHTINLTGNVTGVGSATVGVGNSISITVDTSLVGGVSLGDETTGQYAKTFEVSGIGLTATAANADDGTDYIITSNATPSCVTGTIVARDSNGDFCANQINLSGISGNINIPHPTGGTIPTPTYGSTSISGILGVGDEPNTYLLNFIIDGGNP